MGQRGVLVVVQSPISKIGNGVSAVPVKRFRGGSEKDNSLCLLPTTDVEKDSNSDYEKEFISRKTSWVEAHGIAVCDSECRSEFQYRRNELYWIFIGFHTCNYQSAVPVVNLRTYEAGEITINHVCWYPRFRGSDNAILTLGGEERKWKHSGPRSFSTLSWAICQKLGWIACNDPKCGGSRKRKENDAQC